jgi:hypothetical protein
VRRDCLRRSGVAVLAAKALEAGEAGCWDIELLGVMTRNRFLGKKRTTHQYLYCYSIGTGDIPPFPDPGVPDGLKIPLFAISPNGVPFPLDTTFLISAKGVVSLLLLSSTDSSCDELSFVKLPGSIHQQQREEVNKH